MPTANGYRRALGGRDFRLLWMGSSASLVGDGMTFVALAWLVPVQRLGLLMVCATLPVFAGGLLVGPLLDRFDRRHVLAADSILRGAVMASVPLTAACGGVPEALPFVVAGVYGLLKMVPLAGFPAAIPDLVPAADLDAANALESLSFGSAGMAGPALAGLLIPLVGAPSVLAFDTATYLIFAITALAVRHPLLPHPEATAHPAPGTDAPPPPLTSSDAAASHPSDTAQIPASSTAAPHPPHTTDARTSGTAASHPPDTTDARSSGTAADRGLWGLARDGVLVRTTVAFMAFNVAEGMLLVVGPWLAKTRLPGGSGALGGLMAALACGELVGAAVAGSWRPARRPLTAIAAVQVVAAAGFLGVLAEPRVIVVAAGFLVIGLFSAPMTVWAQSVRMERIPSHLRGRGFTALRTLMQGTPPLGALLVTPILRTGSTDVASVTMAALAALPALLLLRVPRVIPRRIGTGRRPPAYGRSEAPRGGSNRAERPRP